MIEAGKDRCQEASIFSREVYLPCNAPATQIVGWPTRPGEPDLRMCDGCADHNIRHRGAQRIRFFCPADANADIPL